MRMFEFKTCNVDPSFSLDSFKLNAQWPYLHQVIPQNKDLLKGYQITCAQAQVHLTCIALISCLVSPMMTFAAGTVNRALGINSELLLEAFGQASGITDIFYCHARYCDRFPAIGGKRYGTASHDK